MTSLTAGVICTVAITVFCVSAEAVATARGDAKAATAWAGIAVAAYGAEALFDAMGGEWWACGVSAALAAFWFWTWRRGRKNRKRSLKALGNKARARLAEMPRNMPKPGTVLRPVPQEA